MALTVREIIAEAQLYIGDPNGDFHSDNRVLTALNRALRRISSRSRSIHQSFFHSVRAEQYEYALPPGTVFIRKAKYFNGIWEELIRHTFHSVEDAAAYPGGGPPTLFSMWTNARVEKFVGEVTAIDFDPDRTEDFQRSATFGQPYRDPTSSDAIKIGDLVFNLSTRHAEAQITGVNSASGGSETQIFYTRPIGGDASVFSVTNQIRVTSPNTSGHSMIIAPAPIRTDESGEESIAVFVARRHRIVEQSHIDNENDTLELDDEFADSLMYEILHWLCIMEDGLDVTAQKSLNYRTLANTEYNKAMPLVMNRIHQNLSAWNNGLARGRGNSDYREIGGHSPSTGQGFNSASVR